MSSVFVLDANKQPLNPIPAGRARILLSEGRAAVFKRYPFTIILKYAVASPQLMPLRLKINPGSKTTGLAIVNDASGQVVFAAELAHRGHTIKATLDARRAVRRSRRQRKTRYRKPRFNNRRRLAGWLPPSLVSRIANVLTWVKRLGHLCPIVVVSMEMVKFDTQLLEHPDIQGVEYQQGTLAGYELREYLLEKWRHRCAYCAAQQAPLQIEHIHPRATGGSQRVSNLALACEACNRAKGTLDVRVFLASKPNVLALLLAQAQAPLKDSTVVNLTRWALYERLKGFGLPIECSSGGVTKYNRSVRNLPKAHWIDAANVGKSTPLVLNVEGVVPLLITANGHGSRQMCRMDRYGFPRTSAKASKRVQGYQTGDIIKAIVPSGKKKGTYEGRVALRSTGSFNITTKHGTVHGISHRFCTQIQHVDGYSYQKGETAFPPAP